MDDDEAFLSLTEEVLERRGVRVSAESDSSRALARVREGEFQCVVSDYEMPGVDGLELLERVREVEPALPFVVLTGAGSEDVAAEAISLGATEYVQKQPGRGQFDILVNTVVNAAEAYRTEQLLEASRAFVEDAIESVRDVFYVADLEGELTHWNSRFLEVTGLVEEELAGTGPGCVVADDEYERVREAFEAAVREGSTTVDVAVETGDGGRVPFEFTFSTITDESGRPTHVAGIGRDVSDRVEREETVTTLHETTRALVAAESVQETYEVAMGAASDLLALPAAAIYRWNEDEHVLEPAVATDETRALFGELPVFGAGEAIAFEVFVAGETRLVEDVPDQENVYNEETVIESELFVPIGSHGVLVSGAASADALADVDVAVVEILAENAATALDRHEREAALRETERELAAKTERLAEANRTNAVVRRIQTELVQASSRGEVEAAVCEALCTDGPYVFAWVGSVTDGSVSPRTWAGEGEVLLDALTGPEATPDVPAVRAVERGEVVVESDLVASGPHGRRALTAGAQSVACFPLAFDGNAYGVLTVYGEASGAFTGDALDILGELADTMANALNAIERKEALVTGGDVELVFEVPEPTGPLSTLARRLDESLELEEVMAQQDGSWLLYVTIGDGVDEDAVLAAANSLVSVTRADAFDSDSERALFGFAVSEFPCVDVMAAHGASVQAFSAHPSHAEVVVTLPRTREVRPFVAACASRLPGVELVRRTQARQSQSVLAMDSLTDKQRHALRTAYEEGFFAWPREHTGEEVADAMGVSAPTFHQHLRKALQHVLRDVFGDRE